MLDRSNINEMLDDSFRVLNEYQTELQSKPQAGTSKKTAAGSGDVLGDVVSVFTSTSLELKNVLDKGRVAHIDGSKIKAVEEAIEKMLKEPSTKNKVNAVQLAIFGINLSLMQVLKEMQNLLHTVESLKKTRGKRVAHIEDMGNSTQG